MEHPQTQKLSGFSTDSNTSYNTSSSRTLSNDNDSKEANDSDYVPYPIQKKICSTNLKGFFNQDLKNKCSYEN